MKKGIAIVIVMASFIFGFYIGRNSSTQYRTEFKYVKGKVVRDTIKIKSPIYSYSPQKIVYLNRSGKSDTSLTSDPKDTLESLKMVLNDWNTKRVYSNTLFDDTVKGKIEVRSSVQYNKLVGMEYEYYPITKVESFERKRVVIPYVGADYSTLNILSVGGGFFYHNMGVELMYNKNYANGKNGLSFGIKYKF